MIGNGGLNKYLPASDELIEISGLMCYLEYPLPVKGKFSFTSGDYAPYQMLLA